MSESESDVDLGQNSQDEQDCKENDPPKKKMKQKQKTFQDKWIHEFPWVKRIDDPTKARYLNN